MGVREYDEDDGALVEVWVLGPVGVPPAIALGGGDVPRVRDSPAVAVFLAVGVSGACLVGVSEVSWGDGGGLMDGDVGVPLAGVEGEALGLCPAGFFEDQDSCASALGCCFESGIFRREVVVCLG